VAILFLLTPFKQISNSVIEINIKKNIIIQMNQIQSLSLNVGSVGIAIKTSWT
jgi:hypothetical protein